MNNQFSTRLVFGLIVLTLGIGLFLDQLGIRVLGFYTMNIWPIILIIIGAMFLSRKSYLPAAFFLIIGSESLASNLFHTNFWSYTGPLFIIAIGVYILMKPSRRIFTSPVTGDTVTQDTVNETVMFWGLDRVIKSKQFGGGTIECVFGGGKLDLRQATILDGAVLTIDAVFGGFEVILPDDVRAQVTGTAIFGGYSDKTVSNTKSSAPTITINGTAVFGGVEVKN